MNWQSDVATLGRNPDLAAIARSPSAMRAIGHPHSSAPALALAQRVNALRPGALGLCLTAPAKQLSMAAANHIAVGATTVRLTNSARATTSVGLIQSQSAAIAQPSRELKLKGTRNNAVWRAVTNSMPTVCNIAEISTAKLNCRIRPTETNNSARYGDAQSS